MKKNKIFLMDFLYSRVVSFLVLFIICLSTFSLTPLPIFSEIINKITLVVCFGVFFIYLLNGKYSKFSILLMLFWVLLFLSSYLGEYSSIKLAFTSYYKFMAIVFYLDYGLNHYCEKVISSLYYVLYLLIVINFYTLIKYPNGWYSSSNYANNWFFDYDNLHIFMYFPAILIMYVRNYIKDKKISIGNATLMLMITYGVYYCFSANTVVAYTLFLVYLFFKKFFDSYEILNSKTYFIIYLVIFFAFVLFRVQDLFAWLIVGILGKSLTFTNRTIIWDKIISFIKTYPLLGYGREPTDIVTYKLGKSTYTHAHNTILDVTYKGGILSLVVFISLLNIVVKKLYEYKNYSITKLVSFILFCAFIMMNFEARQEKIGLYIILIVSYHIQAIIVACKKSSEGCL